MPAAGLRSVVCRALVAVALPCVVALVSSIAGAEAQRRPSAATACRSFTQQLTSAPRAGGSVPARVRARFAVLRRARRPADVPPASSGLRTAITGPFTSYDPSSLRRLGTVPGGDIYLVSGSGSAPRVSARCARAMPAAQRRALRAFADELPAGPGYCLLEYAPMALGRELCDSYAAIAHGRPIGADSRGAGTDYLALVPDGVGAVTLSYASPQPPVALTVSDNLASGPAPAGFTSVPDTLVHAPVRLRRFLERTTPTAVTWLAAPGGPVVRTFPRRAAEIERELKAIEDLGAAG
jgi:hypothetical protein